MNDNIIIDINKQYKNQDNARNLIRCGSSSLAKRGIKNNSNSLSLFPSDFFSSGDEDNNQTQKPPNILNQPILPNNTNITVIPRTVNQIKSIQSKVVIDFQKEFDEDKELLQMLQGETNNRPNSEEHLTKPFSSRLKRLNKKPVECEIIPEVDEEKMRTSTKIFFEDKPGNKTSVNTHNSQYNYNYNLNANHIPFNNNNTNINASPQKKVVKGIERNNDSISTTNVTYESMKPQSKMKRRYHSGDTKTSKLNIMAVTTQKIDNPNNNINSNKNNTNNQHNLKQLVLPSIRKNPYAEYQKKFEHLFDNLGEFSEEEHIKPKLNPKVKNNNHDIKSVLMKKVIQRKKIGSAPHSETYLKKSPSTSSIPHIYKSKMSLNNNNNNNNNNSNNTTNVQQQSNNKISMKNTAYLNGRFHSKTKSFQKIINNNKENPSPIKYERKAEAAIHYKHKQFPVKIIQQQK